MINSIISCVFVNKLVPLMEHNKFREHSACVYFVLHGILFHHPEEYLAWSSCSRMIIFSMLNCALRCGFYSAFSVPELATQRLSGVRCRVRTCQHDSPRKKSRGLTAKVPKCSPWKNLFLPMRQRDKQGPILRVFTYS